MDLSQRLLADCLADSNAPLKQLHISNNHNNVPFSECSAAQQQSNATIAVNIAPSQ